MKKILAVLLLMSLWLISGCGYKVLKAIGDSCMKM